MRLIVGFVIEFLTKVIALFGIFWNVTGTGTGEILRIRLFGDIIL